MLCNLVHCGNCKQSFLKKTSNSMQQLVGDLNPSHKDLALQHKAHVTLLNNVSIIIYKENVFCTKITNPCTMWPMGTVVTFTFFKCSTFHSRSKLVLVSIGYFIKNMLKVKVLNQILKYPDYRFKRYEKTIFESKP